MIIFDRCVAVALLLVTFPILLIASLGIVFSSEGPIIYRARRVGLNGRHFEMYKLRTMHCNQQLQSSVTGKDDPRVFKWGSILRKTKIDELPQFINVLVGDMALVGPRAEDIGIVEGHYTSWMRESLNSKPGITSPGAIYNYFYGESYLTSKNIEVSYVKNLLPIKLAMKLFT